MGGVDIDIGWTIPERDLEIRFSRSGGPGGQHVNKVSTKVELRLNLAQTVALSSGQKQRLVSTFPSHVTASGEFVVTSDRHRSQQLNQADAKQRLSEMIRAVRRPPRPRIATKPSLGAKKRRLESKRHRSEVKRRRRADWS